MIKQLGLINHSLWRVQQVALIILLALNGSCNNQNQTQAKTTAFITNPVNGFNCGMLDSDGNLWFGSNGGGIYSYNGKGFYQFSESEGLHDNQIYSMIEDKKGVKWFGTSNGIYTYDRKSFTHLPIPFSDTTSLWLDKVYPIINPNAVHALAEDNEGNIWLGTAGNGAYLYDRKNFTSYLTEIGRKQEDSLYHNWIPSITKDASNNIWFASMTHGGVSRYNGTNFTHFMTKDGLSNDMVRTIYQGKSGNIWFGFNGNRKSGLTNYDGEAFHSWTKEDGLCNKNIIAIHEDTNGDLWLGSGRSGLCVFNGKSFSELKTNDGSTYSDVLFILADSKGDIWFGGSQGLWCFDGQEVRTMTK